MFLKEKFLGNAGGSISLRLFVIGFLLMVFFPVSFMVQGLIEERADRQADTIFEVASKWGQKQVMTGPVLVVPYKDYHQNTTKYVYFMPEKLEVDGSVTSSIRSRGIYDVPLYEGEFNFKGYFSQPDKTVVSGAILWDQATVAVGVPDMRGIMEQISIDWNSEQKKLETGVKSNIFDSGVSAPVKISIDSSKTYDFSFTLKLRGSEELYFMPVGKETTVKLASDWVSPSFDGAFLPVEHVIDDVGFNASWSVLDLNRSFPQYWTSDEGYTLTSGYNSYLEDNAFGVKFYLPVDVYQKSTRSAKYAMAVIGLVFLTFFLVEVTSKKRIHPLHYILIGFALCIFYTLLLSLAEYIRFGYAYIVASLAIVGMVGLFSRSVLDSTRLGVISGGVLALLYGFIYVLLQAQDFALLMGSIGLFAILSVVMYVSKSIVKE